jgi:8-oxo-dGTP pyrophosphatase MutT (NUDIX family)
VAISLRALGEALTLHALERADRAPVVAQMQALLERAREPFARTSLDPGHFTASAFVLSPDRGHVLLVRHEKLGRWLQPGGHIELGDATLEAAARREVSEETGVSSLDRVGSGIFDVDAHDIPANPREGAHMHFDVRYLFMARSAQLRASEEVGAARWVPLTEVRTLDPDESVLRCTSRLR